MGPLVLIIVLELVSTIGIIGFSSYPRALTKTKYTISNVLGIQKIAQTENIPPPDQTQPADQSSAAPPAAASPAPPEQSPTPEQPKAPISSTPPAAESSPAPVPSTAENPAASPEQAIPSEQPAASSLEQTTPEQTPSPSETPNLFEQEINPSLAPNPQSSGEPSLPFNSGETGVSQTQAVLSPEDLINSPEGINNKSVEEVKKEDTQLDQTTNPEQQTKLLVDFATDKVKDMNNFSKSDDFTSTNFATQRFNEQMDKAIGNLEKVPAKDQAKLKIQLGNFCDQADKVLRTVQLSVPEEGEQDLEIARGQCQELNL